MRITAKFKLRIISVIRSAERFIPLLGQIDIDIFFLADIPFCIGDFNVIIGILCALFTGIMRVECGILRIFIV